jgi:hypothetical protein
MHPIASPSSLLVRSKPLSFVPLLLLPTLLNLSSLRYPQK